MNNARFASSHLEVAQLMSRYAGGSGNGDWEEGQADDCFQVPKSLAYAATA